MPYYAPEISEGPPQRGVPFVLPKWIERLDLKVAPFTPPAPPALPPDYSYEFTGGPAIRGSPWSERLGPLPVEQAQGLVIPPAPRKEQLVPEYREGPPMKGAPFVLPHWIELPELVSPPVVVLPPTQIYAPEVTAGPPVRGVPIPFHWVDVGNPLPKITHLPPLQPVKGIFSLPSRDPKQEQRTRRHTERVSEIVNSLLRKGRLVALSAANWDIRGAGAFVANRDPTASDDVNAQAQVGSFWLNTVSGVVFICRSNAAGAAIWSTVAVGGAGGSGFTGTLP